MLGSVCVGKFENLNNKLNDNLICYRLEPAQTTFKSNKTRSRKGRSLPRPSPSPTSHEVNKYTYNDATGDELAVNLTDPTSMDIVTPTPGPDDYYVDEEVEVENVHYFADVYMERYFIITGLGHFQDYIIKV